MSYLRMHQYWSSVFGLSPEDFSASGLKVVPHAAGLIDYHGIYALAHGTTLALSAPPTLLTTLKSRTAALGADTSLLETLPHLFSDLLEQTVGPAYQGYLEPSGFRPCVLTQVHKLTPADKPSLSRLREACGETAWAHSGLAVEDEDVYGCFVGGELAAAGKAILWSEDTVNPGVVTHPAHRKRGYGAGVVTEIVKRSLEQRHLVVYQTLLDNRDALSIALRLGFKNYGRSLALRLREEASFTS